MVVGRDHASFLTCTADWLLVLVTWLLSDGRGTYSIGGNLQVREVHTYMCMLPNHVNLSSIQVRLWRYY